MTKKLITTISQASSRITIWMKLSKNATKPVRLEIAVRIGFPASIPTWARRPGCSSCAWLKVPPPAFKPSPANELKTICARLLKLPRMKAKRPM
jgi:hypothetical protein